MRRPDLIILLLILISNLALRLYRIDFSTEPIFDEKAYYLNAARSYLTGTDDPNLEHPPLGKLLVAFGIKTFGDNPYGWRTISAVFSVVGIALTYLLARELFGGFLAPTLAALLLSLDNLYFIHARLATPEIFLTVFIIGALLFGWKYYRQGRVVFLCLLSLFFGLAVSTKWTAFLISPAILFLLFRKNGLSRGFIRDLGIVVTGGAVIYVASYWPFIQKHSFWGFLVRQQTIIGFWSNFGKKAEYNLPGYFLTHAFSWIFNPVWDYDIRIVDERRVGFVKSMFNPAVYWLSIYYVVKTLKRWRTAGEPQTAFLLLPIFLNFLPWLLVRRVQYLYYLLFSLPFLCILTASFLSAKFRQGREGRFQTVWLVSSAALTFLYFYPLITSLPVPKAYFSPLSPGPISITMPDKEKGSTVVTVR